MVRKMNSRDIASVHQLEKECFSRPWSENSLLNEVDKENSVFLVYEIDREVVGYGGMYLVIDEGDITNIAVSANHRRKGVAEEILTEMFDIAVKRGIVSFTLEVRKSNKAAISLYEKLGFKEEGCRKNFYDNPTEDGIIMWKHFQTEITTI